MVPRAGIGVHFLNAERVFLAQGQPFHSLKQGGPVDAAYEAIRQATGLSPKLEYYSIRAVTGGKEALGEATVRITEDGRIFTGRGISTDIIEASAKAYVDAINRMVAAKEKGGQADVKAEL